MNKFSQLGADIAKLWGKYGGAYISGMRNTLLLALTERYLKETGVTISRHRLIPPNDGGICLGQAIYAMHRLN